MYCYIKDGQLVTTSPQLIEKRQEEILAEVKRTRFVEQTVTDEEGKEKIEVVEEEYTETVVIEPFVDGMIYDEVFETKLSGRVVLEKGKIISWEKSKEKKEEDARAERQRRAQEDEHRQRRPSQIAQEL
jgi:hypothetical protein